MSDRDPASFQEEPQSEDQPKGPNLVLIYTLLVLGLLMAAAVAALIVWPFYIRR